MIWVKSRMVRVKAGQSEQSSGRPDNFFCYRLYKTSRDTLNTASYQKVLNSKVVHLVEAIDFDIQIILIRGLMQKLQPD